MNQKIIYVLINFTCAIVVFLFGFCLFPYYFQWRLADISKEYRVFRPTNAVVENTLSDTSLRALGLKNDAQSIKLKSELQQADLAGNLYYFERIEKDGGIRAGYLSINVFGSIVHVIEEK